MKADRTELHNLADTHPEKVKELTAQWEAWAERCHVKLGGGNKNKNKAAKANPSHPHRKGRLERLKPPRKGHSCPSTETEAQPSQQHLIRVKTKL